MLARSVATPTAVRCWSRGLVSVLAPARSNVLTLHDQSGPGVPLHLWQSATLGQDFGRPLSTFPSRVLNFSDRSQRPLYALHVQSASKATVPRDPERPKRPLSGYFRFAAAQREKHGSVKQKAGQIAEAWKKASAAEKQPFEKAAEADATVYKADFDKYKASGKLDAWKRDPAKPKRPLAPFLAWAQQERQAPDLAKLPVAEAGKILGTRWAQLPAEKKAPFEAKYKAEKEKHDSEVKAYKASGAEAGWLKRTGRLEIQQKVEAKKQAQKDKIKETKAKKLAQDANAKEKAKVAKEKATKAKAAKATAAKAKAAKAKEAATAKAKEAATAKAAKVKAAKAADKVKADKAKAAKAVKAKAAKERTLKAKAATAVKAKVAKAKAPAAKAAKAATARPKAAPAMAASKQ